MTAIYCKKSILQCSDSTDKYCFAFFLAHLQKALNLLQILQRVHRPWLPVMIRNCVQRFFDYIWHSGHKPICTERAQKRLFWSFQSKNWLHHRDIRGPRYIYRVVQKRIPSFIFGITSAIHHRFKPFFHCYKQKFMAHKSEVLPPTTPLLCDHIT